MSDLLGVLNAAQRQAVTATEGPVLVLAGPGSGKTRVLTHRVAYLIQERRVPAWRIMAVTFTNKAANEMKERLLVLLGDADLGSLTIGTFHAICVRLLRREADALGIDRNFVIYDDSDQRSLVRQAIHDLNLNDKLYTPRAMHGVISRAKTEMLGPQDFTPSTYREEVARRVYVRYQELLAENNAFDFDDLLLRVVVALREQPALLEKYQRRYQYILVDEFQDTNAVQYELVRQLSGGYSNLFAVGDDDQSIYAFRGADFYNVLRFERDYPSTTKILLEQNYRSTQAILEIANAAIAPNTQRTPKKLFTERRKGALALVHEAYDENQEGRWVVQTIQDLTRDGVSPGDCAVMYRTNAQSRALEDAFLAEGMPYKLVGATRFYARREIKDLMAYLRVVHNPYDTVSMARIINVPARKIGTKTLSSLNNWAASRGALLYDAMQDLAEAERAPIAAAGRRALLRFFEMWRGWVAVRDEISVLELLDRILRESGYEAYLRDGSQEGEDRWENVLEFRAVASEYTHLPTQEALLTFLEEISLVSDVDNLDEGEAPTLLTLHSAKGLEFGAVFIVGLNDGLLPHSRCFEDPDAMEEERRLFYVGVTRAKDRIYLSHTFRRTLYGNSDLGAPSRFLSDIPTHLQMSVAEAAPRQTGFSLGRARESTRTRRASDKSAASQGPYKAGDKVRHPMFGEGTVIEVKRRGGDWDITVAFQRRGIKTLAASFANLSKES
ncbi:MAG: UvrD-helicase domain-containing protein [Anaerolineae bacterium]|nr:UvrD-helicase domain-containing protein [Anaerolineae bacterium]